jgi:purine-binding chemotaxis protein CheW
MIDRDRGGPDPAVAQVWARRAAELARVPPRHHEGEQVDLLLFCLGRETYGFEARHALDVRPASSITPVPRVPAHVAGVTHLRGRILSVLDLARFLGVAEGPKTEENPRRFLLVVEQPNMELALLVDEVLAVRPADLNQLRSGGDTLSGLPAQYVRGVIHGPELGGGDGAVVILDLPALLADEALIVREEMV